MLQTSHKNYNSPHQFFQFYVIHSCSAGSLVSSFINPSASSLVLEILSPVAWPQSDTGGAVMDQSRVADCKPLQGRIRVKQKLSVSDKWLKNSHG